MVNEELIARLRNGLENVMRPAVTGGERAAWLRSNGPDLFIILAALESRPAPTEEWAKAILSEEGIEVMGGSMAYRASIATGDAIIRAMLRFATETVAGGEQLNTLTEPVKETAKSEHVAGGEQDMLAIWKEEAEHAGLMIATNPRAPDYAATAAVLRAMARVATTPERAKALEEALRPMSSAPRDRTFILARYRAPAIILNPGSMGDGSRSFMRARQHPAMTWAGRYILATVAFLTIISRVGCHAPI